MDTLSYKTKSTRKEDVERSWYLLDVDGETVGRVASKVAHVLRGKHRANYTPHVDCGDYVVIINAGNVRFTGNKWLQKEYISYSGYPGGQKKTNAANLLEKKPEAIIEKAIRGMLPKNKLGRQMFKKLFVYAGPDHPHQAQKPQPFNF